MQRALLPWGPGHAFAVGGTGLLIAGSGCIVDSELEETTGSATASCTIDDGASDNGQVLRDYTVSAGQSTSEQWGHHWMPFYEGLYVHTLTGSIKGCVTAWVDHDCAEWLQVEHDYYKLSVLEALAQL